MNRIGNALELSRQSWNALRQNPHLLVFPLISMLGVLVASLLYLIPAGALVIGLGGTTTTRGGDTEFSSVQTAVGVVVMFIYYFIIYTIIIFSNTALVGAAMKLVRGEPATVRDGLRLASSRIGKIIPYALISATVGVLANAARQSGRESGLVGSIIGSIVGSLLQGAWNLIVFFAIPVLVVEDIGVIDSLKRSFAIFKGTWGEGFVGSTTIGGLSCLANLAVLGVGALLVALVAATGSVVLLVAAVVLVVIGLAFVGMISGAVNGIFQASLYAYATTGDAGQYIDTQLAAGAFAPRR